MLVPLAKIFDLMYQLLRQTNVLESLLALTDALDAIPTGPPYPAALIAATARHLAPPSMTALSIVPVEVLPADFAQTQVSGAALTLLLTVVRREYAWRTLVPEQVCQALFSCWPSTSCALLLYARALVRETQETSGTTLGPSYVGSPGHAFTTIVSLLHIYAQIDSLRVLVQDTPTSLALIMSLWRFETRESFHGKQLALQISELIPLGGVPSAADLLSPYILSLPSPKLDTLLSTGDDFQNESAAVALSHLGRSAVSLLLHGPSDAVLETLHVNLCNLARLHSTCLAKSLLSERSPIVVTDVLLRLTSQYFGSVTVGIVRSIIGDICGFLNSYLLADGVPGLVFALERGLLVGLLRAQPWIDHDVPLNEDKALKEYERLLGGTISKYLMYISVVCEVRKFLVVEKNVPRSSSSPCAMIWLNFTKYAKASIDLALSSELAIKRCDLFECSRPATSRCSACLTAIYCSSDCQKISWTRRHMTECIPSPVCTIEGIMPKLPGEDLRFALRVVNHDLAESTICEGWLRRGTIPLRACIDYTQSPPLVRLDAPPDMEEAKKRLRGLAASLAVIYAVLPTGGLKEQGKALFGWDLQIELHKDTGVEGVISAAVEIIGEMKNPKFVSLE
ncbi:hypothetical protein C8F01DRAFT_666385 [Mycena amicta]|nr:hypothetical protein C8F01DRAFT_666385 [Mycena amicta]